MTSISFDRFRRYGGPGYFLGGGFVAGLLLFLAWLAMRPDHDRQSLHASDDNGGDPGALVAPGRGVLGGITAAGAAGRSGAAISSNDSGQPAAGAEAGQEGAPDENADGFQDDADNMAVGEDVGADAQSREGAALTDSLLGPPAVAPEADAAAPAAPGAPLLPYYVEVEVAPGQVQILQLNAESPEHARAILRDFRGDPRVLRGPTTEPLQ